jgi:hypothetical protein
VFLKLFMVGRAHWFLNEKIEYGLLNINKSFFTLLFMLRVLRSMKKIGPSLRIHE